MKIVVIAAMRKELDLLLGLMDNYKESALEDFTVYEGALGSHTLVCAQCGIGKVNSALRTQNLIRAVHPDLVLNSGVAGGVDPSMPIGSVLVGDRIAYHDVWCGPGTEYGAADGAPVYFTPAPATLEILKSGLPAGAVTFGLIASGDKFISKASEVEEIKSHFPDALGCDMESASIAQVCMKEGVPLLVVRVMSDRPGDGDNLAAYTDFWADAPKKTFAVLQSLLNLL